MDFFRRVSFGNDDSAPRISINKLLLVKIWHFNCFCFEFLWEIRELCGALFIINKIQHHKYLCLWLFCLLYSSPSLANNFCSRYLIDETEDVQVSSFEDLIRWENLVDIFIENSSYTLPNQIPKDLVHFVNENRRVLKLTSNNILGHAFKYPEQLNPEFDAYYFISNFKMRHGYEDFKITFGVSKKDKSIVVFAIHPPSPYFKHSYHEKVALFNQHIMGTSEPEYYTIKGFYKGIITLRVSPAIEYKIKTRHNLDIYDVIEPLHVGRIKSRFLWSIESGVVSATKGYIFVRTDRGDKVKIVLQMIEENNEAIFDLKTAYYVR